GPDEFRRYRSRRGPAAALIQGNSGRRQRTGWAADGVRSSVRLCRRSPAEGAQGAQRNAGPIRPVFELMAHVVQRFLNFKQPQQRLHLLQRLVQAAGARNRVVRRQEHLAGLLLPLLEQWRQLVAVVSGFQQALLQRRLARVPEGTQPPRDIRQGRMLRAPFGKRAARLALEV